MQTSIAPALFKRISEIREERVSLRKRIHEAVKRKLKNLPDGGVIILARVVRMVASTRNMPIEDFLAAVSEQPDRSLMSVTPVMKDMRLTYAVVRAAGKWYVTSQKQHIHESLDSLVAMLCFNTVKLTILSTFDPRNHP